MKLTHTAVKNAKRKEKDYKLSDGGGLFLLVTKSGAKYWRMKYRFVGKEKLLAMGVYPEVTLKQARQKRQDAKKLLSDGIDPSEHKKAAKRTGGDDSFECITREWHEGRKAKWTEDHGNRILTRLEKDIFPWIGKQQIATITAPEVLRKCPLINYRFPRFDCIVQIGAEGSAMDVEWFHFLISNLDPFCIRGRVQFCIYRQAFVVVVPLNKESMIGIERRGCPAQLRLT